ncbi:MAG: four helix bundle protein [Terriglobia bacterium]
MVETVFTRRTKRFGLEVIRLLENLPRHYTGDALSRQLLRSSTSVGANYRAACRARSTSDMLSKLSIVEE